MNQPKSPDDYQSLRAAAGKAMADAEAMSDRLLAQPDVTPEQEMALVDLLRHGMDLNRRASERQLQDMRNKGRLGRIVFVVVLLGGLAFFLVKLWGVRG